ncbi:type II CAAX endopeptidase family protein [Umezawaea sp. Da 62-37]|uniref:CPBP family intramembrane glutamic endopeptidase n=1 Tax=Umezawaea sp. Da 62-37 TaxID=3075927 RepID=UPI0028F7042E|nr:type II CAAX endopeptidase family protein [Umezawaea sp. Da 62-37]WNV87909.1 type II CAAX endopeptidase family protein [Umezawaea sp. Da 62-37]
MAEPLMTSPTARLIRPGWPEVLAAGVTYALIYLVAPPLVDRFASGSTTVSGLAYAALSGAMGLLAFAAAFVIRIRAWPAFGIRGPAVRWWFIAGGLGLGAVVLAQVASTAVIALLGDRVTDVQEEYRDAASAGPIALILQLLFLAVLTPVGEEFAFRGVLTNALSRYGAWTAAVLSTLVFAAVHGLNMSLVPAVIVGSINAFLFLRTKSVWPGVLVHVINNGLSTVLVVLVS